jgi:hypothetical protein
VGDTGHPTKLLRNFSGRTGIHPKLTVPLADMKDRFAAESDVPIMRVYFDCQNQKNFPIEKRRPDSRR